MGKQHESKKSYNEALKRPFGVEDHDIEGKGAKDVGLGTKSGKREVYEGEKSSYNSSYC